MAYTTGIADLRIHLSDGSQDRFNFRKRCFGEVNGTNARFKTFEFRRVTDFTLTVDPEAVFKNGIPVPASGIASDSLVAGEFILNTPYIPVDGDVIEASYYNQWFLDSELDTFLQHASLTVLDTSTYTSLSGGLITAALEVASSLAYAKMAQRWRDFYSTYFKVEDEPHEQGTSPVDSFTKLSEAALERGLKLRDDYYTRQGRKLQPLSSTIKGYVRNFP